MLYGRRNRAYAKKRKLEQQLEEVKQQLREYDDQAMDLLKGAGAQGVDTKMGKISMRVDSFPKVVDWESFYNHIQETGEFDLLERRPARVACRSRWEEEEKIPGVEVTPVAKVRWTKA